MSGLELTQDDHGHWLKFSAPDGTSSILHIESLHLRYPQAVSEPIEKWAAAQTAHIASDIKFHPYPTTAS